MDHMYSQKGSFKVSPLFITYLETEDLDQVEAAYLRSWNINFFQIDISSHSKVSNLAPVILTNQYIPCC